MKEFVISRIPKTSKADLEKLCKVFGRKQYEILEQAINFFVKSSLDPKDDYTPKMKLDQANEYITKRYEEDQKRLQELESKILTLEENAYKIRVSLRLTPRIAGQDYYQGKFTVEEIKELFPA